MTTAHLGQQIKRIHPGAYDQHDDAVVGRAMQKRFPGMYDSATAHDFASTQVNLPHHLAEAARAFGHQIPDSHLAKDGREDDAHVTVKYGLHTNAPHGVAGALHGERPIMAKFGKTSLFPGEEHDVVKVDVHSPDLHRLNGKISKLPHTDTHPGYKPHMTIAYVKAGLGKHYEGLEVPGLTGQVAKFGSVMFSDKNRDKVDLPLGNLDADTIPEAPKTLQIQLGQLKDGIRRVVFVARGSKLKINAAQYGARRLTLPAGDFYYRPDAIKPQEVIAAVRDHNLNEILGAADSGYGAPNKESLQGPVRAVMSRDKAGDTVQGVLSDPAHQQQTVEAAKKVTPPQGAVSIEPAENEIADRVAAQKKFKRPAGARWPKPGLSK